MTTKIAVLGSVLAGIACLVLALLGGWTAISDSAAPEPSRTASDAGAAPVQPDSTLQAGFAWNDFHRRLTVAQASPWARPLPVRS